MEIKFRACIKSDKTIHEVLSINFKRRYCLLDMGFADIEETIRWDSPFGFDELEIIQWTGLKDKNGVEIYEGDIIECLGSHVVVYSTGEGGFRYVYATHSDDPFETTYPLTSKIARRVEVTGNIYENSERR